VTGKGTTYYKNYEAHLETTRVSCDKAAIYYRGKILLMNKITKKVVSLFSKKNHSSEAAAKEAEIKIAIRALKAYSNRDLEDMGIARWDIENAVRYGKAANDTDFNHNSVA